MEFKTYVVHQLCEMKRELLNALEGLDKETLASFGPADHWPAAWIAEHCTQIADALLYKSVEETQMHEYADQVQNWTTREPVPGDSYPEPDEIKQRWSMLCDWIISHAEGMSPSQMQDASSGKAYLENILLAVNHTNSHLRSLWCLLGQLQENEKWAEQQSYLACD
jgi:hypothetical protein